MRQQLLARDDAVERHAVLHEVEVGVREIDDAPTVGRGDGGAAHVPFLGNGPVERLGPGRHFAQLERHVAGDEAQSLAQAVAGDAAADREKLLDQPEHGGALVAPGVVFRGLDAERGARQRQYPFSSRGLARANARAAGGFPGARPPLLFCLGASAGLGYNRRRSLSAAKNARRAMKTLLAVVGDGTAGSVLETALLAARPFNGCIVGLNALTTEYAVVFGGEMGFSVSSEVDRTLEREGQERREQARALFHAVMRRHGVTIDGAPGGGISAEWREEAGRQNAVVGTLGRIFDLIVVERPAKLASLAEATLEDALFEGGRPVLMTPQTAPQTLGENIVIAWNNSTETARTVAFAMPFLKRAKAVEVLSVEGAQVPGPSGEEMAAMLRRHGVTVTARHAPARPRTSPGELFLAEAKRSGADLLVKGAYTQSRLRQMIFGGATRHIIMEAEIPVILAH